MCRRPSSGRAREEFQFFAGQLDGVRAEKFVQLVRTQLARHPLRQVDEKCTSSERALRNLLRGCCVRLRAESHAVGDDGRNWCTARIKDRKPQLTAEVVEIDVVDRISCAGVARKSKVKHAEGISHIRGDLPDCCVETIAAHSGLIVTSATWRRPRPVSKRRPTTHGLSARGGCP